MDRCSRNLQVASVRPAPYTHFCQASMSGEAAHGPTIRACHIPGLPASDGRTPRPSPKGCHLNSRRCNLRKASAQSPVHPGRGGTGPPQIGARSHGKVVRPLQGRDPQWDAGSVGCTYGYSCSSPPGLAEVVRMCKLEAKIRVRCSVRRGLAKERHLKVAATTRRVNRGEICRLRQTTRSGSIGVQSMRANICL